MLTKFFYVFLSGLHISFFIMYINELNEVKIIRTHMVRERGQNHQNI